MLSQFRRGNGHVAVAGGISKDGRCHLLVGMSIALLCERLQISIVRFSHQMHENPTCNVMNISGQRGRRGHIKKTLFLSFLINRIRCNHISPIEQGTSKKDACGVFIPQESDGLHVTSES